MRLFDLFEVTADDAYPKQFQEFRKKYARIPSAKKGKLFVQFTNHKDNTIDKAAFANPTDHNDFVGVYGYPIDYVVKHPMDVWYGHNAKYIRVLLYKESGNSLDLTGMSEYSAKRLVEQLPRTIRDMTIEAKTILNNIIKANRIKGKNKWSRAFITLVQNEIDSDGSIVSTRSGKEQTEIVRNMGYDTIIDRAKSHNSATVNDREPEQIIFLSRKEFSVIDIYQLSSEEAEKNVSTSGYNVEKDEKYHRKLAAKIFESIGTKLSESYKHELWFMFWSKRGERLAILPDHTSSSQLASDLQMGQKPHRYFDDTDAGYVKINLNSIHGNIKFTSASVQDIESISSKIKSLFNENNEDQEFTADSKDEFIKRMAEKEEEDNKKYYQNKRNNKTIQLGKIYDKTAKEVLEKYGYSDVIEYASDEKSKAQVTGLIESVANIKHGESFKEYKDYFEQFKKDTPGVEDTIDEKFFFNLPDNILTRVGEFIDTVIEKDKDEYFRNPFMAITDMKEA